MLIDFVMGAILLAAVLATAWTGIRLLARRHGQRNIGEHLRSTQEMLQLVMDNIPQYISWKDCDLIYRGCNAGFAEMVGLPNPESIVGKTDQDLPWTDEQTQWTTQLDKQIMERDEPQVNVIHLRQGHDGKQQWCDISKIPLHGPTGEVTGVLVTIEDITQRKIAEGMHQLHTTALNSAQDSILIVDDRGKPIFANSAFTKESGYVVAEMLGRNPLDVILHPEPRETASAMTSAAQHNRPWSGEVTLRRKNGTRYTADVTITPFADDEGLSRHAVIIARNVTDRKAYEQALDHQAHHDALTGLPNRLEFKERLAYLMSHHGRRRKSKLILMFIDLDKFKLINDTLGHEVGDKLLIEVGKRLQSCLRPEDVLARMGGDEFTIVLPAMAKLEEADCVAVRILDALSLPVDIQGHRFTIGASIGVAAYPEDAEDAESLIKNADAAMYAAKESGRNKHHWYTGKMTARAELRMEVERDLRQAIERDEFEVYYQPIVNVATQQIHGCEALIRWNHPQKGMISPGLFIPVAEETGLIIPIGEQVMREACMRSKIWREMGFTSLETAVNVSSIQFYDANWLDSINTIVEETGMDRHLLNLELTETTLAQDEEREISILNTLQASGVRISIDDFGMGYSSLGRLKRFPIIHMKVDGSFVRDIAHNSDDKTMTMSIINMAHSLGIQVTAEWVENEDQMEIIKALGCDFAQGYLISPPLPADAFTAFLKTRYRPRRAA